MFMLIKSKIKLIMYLNVACDDHYLKIIQKLTIRIICNLSNTIL